VPDYITWDRWLQAAGVEGVDTSRGPRFSHTYLCLQAAASGQGVALATNVLIGDYLDAGRLVRPFPHQIKGAYQYYVVSPEASADRPAVKAFRAWLLDEAGAQAEAEAMRG
jgi:LysR family glycine cleavage system transcriptional activator